MYTQRDFFNITIRYCNNTISLPTDTALIFCFQMFNIPYLCTLHRYCLCTYFSPELESIQDTNMISEQNEKVHSYILDHIYYGHIQIIYIQKMCVQILNK